MIIHHINITMIMSLNKQDLKNYKIKSIFYYLFQKIQELRVDYY